METALVTGPNSGIGRATALELARSGFHVIAAGRSEPAIDAVVEEIAEDGGSAERLSLDLASLQSAREAAHRLRESDRTLDVVINNAGVGGVRGVTQDGFEIQFGVNHLGHFMLTSHLAPAFRPGTRIVQVTSAAHFSAEGIDFGDVRRKTRSLLGLREYAVSKLANILFVRELARRQHQWDVYAVHPGMTDTNIFPGIVKPFLRRLLTPEQGADTVVWCATAADVAGESGHYWRRREPAPPSETARDEELAAELWERSESWCAASPIDLGV